MNTASLTPKMIVDYLKANPGIIQRQTYPEPDDPRLDESAFCYEDGWLFECYAYPECNSSCPHEDSCWRYEPPDHIDVDSPEFGIGEFLSCSVEDGKIVFEAD